ncbi:MAG: hypothetical protein SF052_02295 [Bacteroidia bacterium]|nr:hypothetical protein [Bacteroidia bacterium]
MRTLIPFCILFFSALSVIFAQNGRTISVEEWPKVKKTTMLVVLYEGQDAYNETIKKAVETYWKVIPYQFVTTDELLKLSMSKEYSMLVRNDSERFINRVGRTDRIKSNHLAIYLCGNGADMRNYQGAEAITQYHFTDINNPDEYLYKLVAIVQSMHNYLVFLDTNKITEDNHPKLLEKFNHALANTIHEKTLFLLAEQLSTDLQNMETLKKYYKYEVAIVEKDAIAAAIDAQNPDVIFMHTDPRVKTLYILSAEGGKIMYEAETAIPGFITAGDFAALSRAAD